MENSKTFCIFDVTKFVLSLFVVAIHKSILQDILYPWLRIAVPLFFIISSYLFFLKQNTYTDKSVKLSLLKKYILRNIKLYIFWFIVLFPFTVTHNTKWYDSGLIGNILTYYKSLFFGSTFGASWFISAMIIATIIIFYLSKKINNKTLLVITFIIYCIATISHTYKFCFSENSIIIQCFELYEKFFQPGINSFPVALFWCAIGKCFADQKQKFKLSNSILILIISCVICYLEWYFVRLQTEIVFYDCYLSLAIVCPTVFSVLQNINININIKYSKFFRNTSIIIYTTHVAFINLTNYFMNKFNINNDIFEFFVVVFCTVVLALIIQKLENKRYFKFLKYSH